MSTTTEHRQRSRLMRLLRLTPVPLVLAFVIGVLLMGASLGTSDAGRSQTLWDVGSHLLVLAVVLFAALAWGVVYLQVVEASRGMPGLRAVEEPILTPEAAADWAALQKSLSDLGFRQGGWFSLDDFD